MSSLPGRLGCILIFVSAIFAASLPARASGGERWAGLAETVFRHVAQGAELPNAATPTSFAEDGDGFLWIGSQNGLARWDGYNFRTYKADPDIPGTLPVSSVSALHTDRRGRLWVGTNSGGLAEYDRDHDRFIVYAAGPGGLSHVGVLAIADDGANGLWIGTEAGLDHLDPRDGAFRHLRHDAGDGRGLPRGHIAVLMRDRMGTLWIGSGSGLARRDDNSLSFTTVPLATPKGEAPEVASLFEDSKGRIWIGTTSDGAYVIQAGQTTPRPIQQAGLKAFLLRKQMILAIAEARPGEVWLGTYGEGIVAIHSDTLQTERIRHDPRVRDSLSDDRVWAMYQDRAGLIWVSTNRSISQYNPGQTAVTTIFGASTRANGISGEDVHLIQPAPDGRVWLGLSEGIDILDPAGARVGRFRADSSHPATALPKVFVDAAAVSATGEVYLGTQRGLYHANPLARWTREPVRVPLPGSDLDAEVWALFLDKGVLWTGGPQGLGRLDLKTGRGFVHFRDNDRLTDPRVTVIEHGPPGQLWVGTGSGLNLIDETGREPHIIERIQPRAADKAGLLPGFISTLLTDRQGRLWVGTVGGISVLLSRDMAGHPVFRRIGLAEGLPNDDVNKLLQDGDGNIWASTDNGLAVIDPSTFAVRTLDRAAGVAISTYWVNSGAITPQGELLFGGAGGLTVVRPDRLKNWTYNPPIVITNARVGGRPVPASRFNRSRLSDLSSDPRTDALSVTPDSNSIAVEFASLDYSAPEGAHYAYRLDGYEKNWTESDSAHRIAAYTNLPPGNYSLWIRGTNREGAWSEQILKLPIRVLPAWYQTVLFRLAAMLAALTVVITMVQARTAQLRRHERQLENSVSVRTSELEQSRQQLEKIAYLDFLTGLPNRRMFTDDFRKLLARTQRQGARFALLLIDLDGFKQINDTYGHDCGDALLKEVAIRLRRAIRESDSVARLGGDEFAILLADDHDGPSIERVCRRVHASFIAEVSFNDSIMQANLSIGSAIFPDHGLTQDDLYKSADLALYESKRARGNSFETIVDFVAEPASAVAAISHAPIT